METLSHSFGVNARRVIRNLKTILVIFAIRHWFCPSATLEETSENDETGIFVNQSFTSELKGQAAGYSHIMISSGVAAEIGAFERIGIQSLQPQCHVLMQEIFNTYPRIHRIPIVTTVTPRAGEGARRPSSPQEIPPVERRPQLRWLA